ncbi:Os07g0132901 [Oryza sativa Japonica Group]|uniref:Os07g0132901 protein n=1 Tax=Oryza sativa subsp. japonica TaxID=39947 RepID=A0A0P0X210_ORYSJ|nr:Os07g0132901 [Oryza sativa Japonica Group]
MVPRNSSCWAMGPTADTEAVQSPRPRPRRRTAVALRSSPTSPPAAAHGCLSFRVAGRRGAAAAINEWAREQAETSHLWGLRRGRTETVVAVGCARNDDPWLNVPLT